MPNPNDLNLITLNAFVPSSFLSGALVQLVIYIQNLNFKSWLKKGPLIFLTPSECLPLHGYKRSGSLKARSPFDLKPLKRLECKKDFHSW
jgi:hypothetical protein